MTDKCSQNPRISFHVGNYIPVGRQIPRTPPSADVKRNSIDLSETFDNDGFKLPGHMEAGVGCQDDNVKNSTHNFNVCEPKPVSASNILQPDDTKSLLSDMKGYQLTTGDLEFIKHMKEEKLIKKLQGDLEHLSRILKGELMALELILASKEKTQAELKKFPSSDELIEWVKEVFKKISPSDELPDLDAKTLLTMVTKQDVEKAIDKQRIEITKVKNMVENKRRKAAKERGRLEKQLASEQLNLQCLISELSDLKSKLAQEICAAVANEGEIEDIKATKTHGKQRKMAGASTAMPKVTSTQSQLKRPNANTRPRGSLEDEQQNKNTKESRKTSTKVHVKQKSGVEKQTKPMKAAKVLVVEQEPVQAMEGGQKSVLKSSKNKIPQPKRQSRVKFKVEQSLPQTKTAAGDVRDKEQNCGLRRSKRIACRT